MNEWYQDDGNLFLVNPEGKILGRVIRTGFSDRFTAHTESSGCIGEYINRAFAKIAVEKALGIAVTQDEKHG